MSTNVPGHSEPEYLGLAGSATSTGDDGSGRSRRRTGIVAASAVAVAAAVGAGAYGVVQLMAGGTPAATAVPADAVGFVSIDLDPSATQKIEAVKILRKFPGVRKELDISSRDDLREAVFENLAEDSDCKDLDYARDVEPWIGDRLAVAAVPDSKEGALPLVVLQVSDQEKARSGADRLSQCAGQSTATGVAFVGDYMLLAENQKQADAMAADAEASSLADAKEFTSAMARVGKPGII
jgi:hypothetical protein